MKGQCFQVGEFFLDPANRLLQHGGAAVSLSPKAFDALVYLVQNPGRLLTRDELIRALWPDSYVEEGNLSVHIFQVRRALGTAADGRAYIQTVPKKGYRFNAEVKVVDQPSNGGEVAPPINEGDLPELQRGTDEPRSVPQPTLATQGQEAPVEGKPGHRWRSWTLLAGGAACLLVLGVAAERFFPVRHEGQRASSTIRLTSFSPELSVSAAAISPDGKTLAYANPAGIFLEETSTKETRPLRSPAMGATILHLGWFPDESKLLATGAAPDDREASVWLVPAKGPGDPERVGAFHDGVVSPDGSQIALVRESKRVKELLLLPTAGGPAAARC